MTYTWDTEKIAALHWLDCEVTGTIDFWVATTLEGYIIEFAAENHQYFSCTKEDFKKYARGRLLKEISLWIKVFLMEEKIMTMSLTRIVV